jgi:hypothetical protein
VLGESFNGGLGHVVGGVAGRVGDALFGAGYYYGGWFLGVDEGEEGGYSVYDAEEVGIENLVII